MSKVPEKKKVKKKKYDLDTLLSELKDSLTERELSEWTYRDLMAFKEDGSKPTLSKRDNYKQSRIRHLDPSEWTTYELMDWLEGDVVGHRSTRDKDIWEEIYMRWEIPPSTSEEDAVGIVIHNREPDKTDNGLLINDRSRDHTPLIDLTYSELCSMYIGDVKNTFKKKEIKKRIMRISRILDEGQFNERIERFKNGDKNMTTLTDQLIGALDARKELYRKYGARVTDQQLATNLTAFYNTLRLVTKADYAEFSEAWRSLLKNAHDNYTSTFHPSQIRRGWALLNLSPGNVQVLDRLLTLIVGTRNPATRRNDIRAYNLDYILENINNSKERDNIATFYSDQE